MAKRIDTLVGALSHDPLSKDEAPILLIGMGDPRSKKNPLKVVNAITGDEAIKFWNTLTKPRKDDHSGANG